MLFISLIWHWSVNIGIWWYNWRPESMHILQVGLHSCSSCHWSHHGAKNAFMEWNGWTWTLARGKCCFVCFSFSTLAPCGLSRMFCRKTLASDVTSCYYILYLSIRRLKFRTYYLSWMVAQRIITCHCLTNVLEKVLWLSHRKLKVWKLFLFFLLNFLICIADWQRKPVRPLLGGLIWKWLLTTKLRIMLWKNMYCLRFKMLIC